MSDFININIPKKSEYLNLVRLAASGIANNIGFSYDEIEDIKMALGEACLNACYNKDSSEKIDINFQIHEDEIEIEVFNVREHFDGDSEEANNRKMGLMIIASLMDEVKFIEEGCLMMRRKIEEL